MISVQAILEKAVGQIIFFNRVLPNGTRERLEGTLLSAPSAVVGNANGGASMTYNGMVVKLTDGRILLNPSGEIEVTSIPEGLISTPTLLWELTCKVAGNNAIELSYITQGMSWKADYVLSLDKAGVKGPLQAWVTMTNQSGKTFKDATLKLLAGEVNRVMPNTRGVGGRPAAMEMKADAAFLEESFADYHLYTMQRPATLGNREIKQLSLFEASEVTVERKLIFDPTRGYEGIRPSENEFGNEVRHPQIQLLIRNEAKNKLGMPMPAGTFKVYQSDSSGSVQLLGEDSIPHTPKDEVIKLELGKAFDVVAERKRTAYQVIRSGNTVVGVKESFAIEFRNRKSVTQRIYALERFSFDYKITASSEKYEKLDANTIQFAFDLKENETRTVTFSVETRW